jgi:hypothetical protein
MTLPYVAEARLTTSTWLSVTWPTRSVLPSGETAIPCGNVPEGSATLLPESAVSVPVFGSKSYAKTFGSASSVLS